MRYLGGDVRAFAAAIQKELRQVRRYPFLLLGLVFWPVLLPSVYVLMGRVYSGNDPAAIAAFAERSGVSSVAGLAFVGFSMYMWLSLLLWGPGTSLRQEQVRGSLEAVYLTPASRLVILFGPPVAHLYTTLFMFAVSLAALRLFFGVEIAWDAIVRASSVIVVAIPAMYAISALFSAVVLRYGEVGPAVQFVRGILVLVSGVSFPVVMLPDRAQAVAMAVPPTYIVEDMRRVMLSGAGLGSVAGHLALVIGMTAVIAALAVLVYRWVEAQARRTGMLGRY